MHLPVRGSDATLLRQHVGPLSVVAPRPGESQSVQLAPAACNYCVSLLQYMAFGNKIVAIIRNPKK